MRLLQRASARRHTAWGNAHVSWRRTPANLLGVGGRFQVELNVTVPPGATATLELPLLGTSASSGSLVTLQSAAGCNIKCAEELATTPSGSERVEACSGVFLDAKCKIRPDGERVLAAELAAGFFHFVVFPVQTTDAQAVLL